MSAFSAVRIPAFGLAVLPPTGAFRKWASRIESRRAELIASSATIRNNSGEEQSLSEMCSLSSKRPFWCRFLYRLVRSTQPKRCLELGSCVGISASYIAAAMKENGFGKLTTLEGSPSLADIARQTLAGLGLGNAQVVTGRFSDTLPGVLGHSQFDFVFIDGHHDRDATIQYFEQILPHATGTIVFDDITWSQGMLEAWAVVSRHARVKSASQLRSIGVCEL